MKGSLSVLLALLAIEALAQPQLEVLPLRSRTAEELIPILRPLVEPGGVLTGQGYQLIVRASPRNLEEIRSAIASLDRPPRRLVIAVRQGASAAQQASDLEARVRIGPRPRRDRAHRRDDDEAARERRAARTGARGRARLGRDRRVAPDRRAANGADAGRSRDPAGNDDA
ncbi:MAG: secretin N-terminal domain-containing protein [Burkholderiales bacterium]|nr:secretin N-terminal domain-containing protein [Burkholderiales bacterium]